MERPRAVRILRIIEESRKVKTFLLEERIDATPGQYLMIWVPGVDEIPLSLSYIGYPAGITVLRVGDATSALHSLQEGDLIGVRGPYGKGFRIVGRDLLIVGGGVGVAPLAPLAEEAKKRGCRITILVGGKSREDVLFLERFRRISDRVIVTTEDGSLGERGLVTDPLPRLLSEENFDCIYACGPERMLVKILELTRDLDLEVQLSLDRYIKCGIGICGHCSLMPTGYRVCKDGPVFTKEELLNVLDEFGKFRRDAAGRRVPI